MNDLNDRTAVITGAGSGIGRALAAACAARGMQLVLADLQQAALEETARLAGQPDSLLCITDVSDAQAVQRLAQRTFDKTGDTALLFNNAGVLGSGTCWKLAPEDWHWILGVNLMGVAHGIREFVPRMIGQGRPARVVNTASGAGLISAPGGAAYCASKHAVVALSECLYHDLALQALPIGVSVVCPSYVNTGITASEQYRPAALATGAPLKGPGEERLNRTFRRAPLTADQVADIILRGIDDDHFYILPHPEVAGRAQSRLERIGAGGPPAAMA
ncbi:Short-chain dehydrogenase/reductase SDR [Cupriavidus necator]|uniref:Short-chain dehydrogenase/reductase SDR n=1 Tax=Cupriavidus necator TaxID=106590 RepID=A0A1K0JI92_CUPNE|nr:Short-chain dehydrogenase/reductase SDR [Cupriavidus necator]